MSISMKNDFSNAVAVLLSTYNGAEYLSDFLDSLCFQSFKDFCVYVRDDGSTDETLGILRDYELKLNIRFLSSGERLGPAKAFLRVMREADDDHDCYLFADQDDYWCHDKIERAYLALMDCPEDVVLYCSRLEYVDENLKHIKLSRIPRYLSFRNALVENIATGCTVALSSRLRFEVIASDPYDVIMHDWWLYMYAAAFGRVIYDPKATIKYRQHGSNTIGAATSAWDDLRRRWVRFISRQGGVHQLSRQCKAFQTCYGDRLLAKDRLIVERLVDGTRNPLARVLLVFASPVSRQRRIDTLILRLLFLIGRY